MALTITIDDPETIAQLRQYRQFIEHETGAEGTVDQAAEGLILTCLDEYPEFAAWKRKTRPTLVTSNADYATIVDGPARQASPSHPRKRSAACR